MNSNGQPQWQRKQEEMRRKQQMGAAWEEKQKAKAKKQPEKQQPDSSPQYTDKFAQVEEEVARLRQELAAGRLTKEQFKARLHELMVQDEQGTWWMIGFKTGGWYRHDGTDWVPDQPVRHSVSKPGSPPSVQQVTTSRQKSGRIGAAVVVLLLGMILAFVVSEIVGAWTFSSILVEHPDGGYYTSSWEMAEFMALVSTVIVLVSGVILTIVMARRVYRRR